MSIKKKSSKKSSSSTMQDIAVAAVTEAIKEEKKEHVETEEERKARKLARREKKRLAAEAEAAAAAAATPTTDVVMTEDDEKTAAKKEKKKRKAENLTELTTEIEDILSNKKPKVEPVSPSSVASSSSTPATPTAKSSIRSALPSTPSSAVPKTGNSSMDALLDGAPAIADCEIDTDIVNILAKRNPPITHLFPIQAKTFDAIRQGRDVLARAKTGTGKTLAFALPIVQKLQTEDKESKRPFPLPRGRMPRVLVLAPTRELAKQVMETFEMVGTRLSSTCVYGGAPYAPMEASIRKGVDVVVGTCGRVQDLLDKGSLKFDHIRYVIMDEADEMLNMGFADDVEKILQQIPRTGGNPIQTLLFSATVPSWVETVAKKYLRPDRQYIDLVGNQDTRASTDVVHYAIPCHWQERNAVMSEVIQVYGGGAKARTIIFTETKKDCNELAMALKMDSQVLHGDIPQAQRENTLKGFRDGKFTCLVATDVAARGIDIQGVELVIQAEPPEKVETYIHRSGRTGRAGMKGVAITFYTPKQLYYIQNIERHAKIKMVRAPLPQKSDLIKSGVEDALKQIAAVHPDVLPHFMSSAQQLISERDPVQVIAACIAQISGHTQPLKQRSLLCGANGYVTVWLQYKATPIRSLSFVWHMIRKYLWEECDDKVKGMRLTADKLGAVFDIPQDQEHVVKELQISDPKLTITIPTELPPVDDIAAARPEPRTRSWGRGASSGGGRGGGFSRGGGRGGGGGRGRGGRR